MSPFRLLLLPVVASLSSIACPTPGGEGEGEGEEGEGEGEGEGEEGEGDCGVVVPAAYVADGYAVNAAEALALRAQLDTLTGATTMRGAEQGTATVADVAALTTPFTAGDPSLADITHASATALVNDAFAEFVEVVAAGDVTLVDAGGLFTPGAGGGIFGTDDRGINEGGLEPRQVVDKALFGGGAFYGYALSLTEGAITPATVDAISAAWGGNETLDAAGALADAADYTNDMGYHQEAKDALIAARAYAADAACVDERDEALVSFFRIWEKAMFARFVHYANAAAVEAAAAADADAFAGAFHELAEGVGLAAGFRGLPAPAAGPLAASHRIVTDAQIEGMLEDLGVDLDDLGASSSGALLIESNFATPVLEVEAAAGVALGVDAAEVQGWREPTAG